MLWTITESGISVFGYTVYGQEGQGFDPHLAALKLFAQPYLQLCLYPNNHLMTTQSCNTWSVYLQL
jgi:hypothetical protein